MADDSLEFKDAMNTLADRATKILNKYFNGEW